MLQQHTKCPSGHLRSVRNKEHNIMMFCFLSALLSSASCRCFALVRSPQFGALSQDLTFDSFTTQSPLCCLGHEATVWDLHLAPCAAALGSISRASPLLFRSPLIVRLYISFECPLFLFLWGVRWGAVWGRELGSIWQTYPSHRQHYAWIFSSMVLISVLFRRSSWEIVSCQQISRMCLNAFFFFFFFYYRPLAFARWWRLSSSTLKHTGKR